MNAWDSLVVASRMSSPRRTPPPAVRRDRPSTSRADRILQLQRTIGNSAVQDLLRVLAKSEATRAADPDEQEVDDLAGELMRAAGPEAEQEPEDAPLSCVRRSAAEGPGAGLRIGLERSSEHRDPGAPARRERDVGSPRLSGTLPQRVPVAHRVSASRLQRKWRLDSTKVMVNNDIDMTRKNGSTSGFAVASGVFSSASAEQEQGIIRQKIGGEAQIANSSMTRYVFKNDGKDNDFLQVITHGSVSGNAKAEALRFGRSAGVVWGQVVERTASNPTPPRRALFDPVKAGGISAATVGDLGTIDVDIPVGEGSIHIKIPLKQVDEGAFAPYSDPVNATHESPSSVAEVEIMVGGHASAEADIESAFFGLSPTVFGSDSNSGRSGAAFDVRWESRPAPEAPKAPSTPEDQGVAPAAAQCGVSRKNTPAGKVRIDKGPLKGKDVEYGDPRHKHTKVGDCPVPALEKAANDRDPNRYQGELKRFSQACDRRDTSYGSQLADNGSSDSAYKALVKDALENGKERAGKYHHSAGSSIGVDVQSKAATKKYRVDVSATGQGAHVIPLG